MKKILSLVFVFAMLLNAAGNAAFARFDGPTWFQSMDNLQKLRNYSLVQAISGDVTGQADGQSGSGNFTFNIKSDIVNRGNFKTDSKNTMDGKIRFALQGKERPFNDAEIGFRLSVISLDKFGVYFRVENMDLNANGILKKDLKDYLDFKTEFAKAIDPIKWQWIRIPNQYLKDQLGQGVPMDLEGFDAKAMQKDITKNGFKKAIQKAIKAQINTQVKDGQMEKEEAAKAQALVDRFFNTEFFKLKSVSGVGKEDSTTFALNNNRILEFIKGASEEMGEAITKTDLADVQAMLGKFNLNGLFHQNAEFGIFDRLKVKLIVKNVEQLDRLQINYGMKIGNINAVAAIKPPAKSINLDDANLGFLPPATNTDDSEMNLDIIPMEPEPLSTDGF
jgi:hypothetical protein